MKFIYSILFSLLIISFAANAQTSQAVKQVNEGNKNIYPIDGSYLLHEKELEVAKYVKENPDMFTKMKFRKASAWGFSVGSTKQWYAYNFVSKTNYLVSSTCRAIGPHSYIFVEDSLWGTRVTQPAVDSVLNAFENSTPANANKGIYQTDVETFGNPPDVDNDPRIIILILNIQDGFSGTGGYTAGYFYSYNETNQLQSNQAEIYYIDANPTDLTKPHGLETAMSTTAHEFQHMIHWNYHRTNPQSTFINEGCSLIAETICGYPAYRQDLYANETNHYLFDWRTDPTVVLNDYSRAQKFFLYLHDQFGVGLFKNIVNSQQYEIYALNDALSRSGYTIQFFDMFKNWEIANKLNNRSVNSAYGYLYPNLTKSVSSVYYNPNVSESVTLDRLAANYYTFTNGSNLNIKFTASSTNIVIKAIKESASGPAVVDVPVNQDFAIPDFGITYQTVHFIVINTSDQANQSYSFIATGTGKIVTTELKWDETEPTGVLSLNAGDSVAVVFDGIQGGRLDSIRVALRQAGAVKGNINEYNNSTSLGGKQLIGPITAVSTIGSKPAYPYPVPWSNWVTVNLTSSNIDVSKPFVVSFLVEGTYPEQNRVMVTNYNSTSAYHSYFYQSSTGKWVYYTDSQNPGYVFLNLIRAYVTTGLTGVHKEIELTPKDFSLSQNYPNPFNPSTTIKFSLPNESRVRIRVFNQLGEVVREVTNKIYAGGEHQIIFDGAGLASGIYYYKIDTDNYSSTRKMVLMK